MRVRMRMMDVLEKAFSLVRFNFIFCNLYSFNYAGTDTPSSKPRGNRRTLGAVDKPILPGLILC